MRKGQKVFQLYKDWQKSWRQLRVDQIEDTKDNLYDRSQRKENDIKYKCGKRQMSDYVYI